MRRFIYITLSIMGILTGLFTILLSSPTDPYESGSTAGYLFGGLLIVFGVAYLFKRMFAPSAAPVSGQPATYSPAQQRPRATVEPAAKPLSEKEARKEAKLKQQVEQYYSLPFIKTYRGIAALVLCGAATLGIIVLVLGGDQSGVIDVIALLILATFVAWGQRWAMIAGMILWIAAKVYQLTTINPPDASLTFLVSVAIVGSLNLALKVENQRRQQPEAVHYQ